MHLRGGLTAAWPGDLLLPDLGCPGKGQEAAGRSCWRQSRRQGQAGLTGISLHHLDQTCMVKQLPLPSLPSPLPGHCPHTGEAEGEQGCGMGDVECSLAVAPLIPPPAGAACPHPQPGTQVRLRIHVPHAHRSHPSGKGRRNSCCITQLERDRGMSQLLAPTRTCPFHPRCCHSARRPPERKEALLIRSGALNKTKAEGGMDFFFLAFFVLKKNVE